MPSLKVKISNINPDQCDYYHRVSGQPIVDTGYIVTDWHSTDIFYIPIPHLPTHQRAELLSSAIEDFRRWMCKPYDPYNALSVCTTRHECVIAPAIWCHGNEHTANYLAVETLEGYVQPIN